ncbi:MAG: mechanosensitive ion channel [Caulobacter sp.]|nr:mechanosensitive ion channel [Caulobacter sp.]
MQQDLEALGHIDKLVLFSIGKTPVTSGSLIAALLTFVVALVAARLIALAMQRVRAKATRGGAGLYIVEKLSTYGLLVFGAIAGVSTLGIDLSSLAVFGGALGVGVGLGLQGVVKEFVSGIVLIFDESLRVGDYIELESGQRGVIHEIGARATRIRNNDSVDILIPNSQLIQGTVTNWTLRGHTRRIRIPFRAAYGVDKEKVRDAVLEAAVAVPFTLPDSGTYRTQVWLVGFGESGLNFELVVWPRLEAVKRPNAMQAAYTWAIDDALRKAGIEAPFPQQDLRIRSLFGEEGDAARRTLGLQAGPAAPTRGRKARASSNDAVDDLLRPPDEDEEPPAEPRKP